MKHIFFDIDGTLLSGDNTVPKKTIVAIKKLKENGNKVYICTGRTKGYVKLDCIKNLDFDGAIYGCGTHIVLGKEDLIFNSLSANEMEKIKKLLDINNTFCVFEGPDYLYMRYEEKLFHTDEKTKQEFISLLGTQDNFAFKLKSDLGPDLKDFDISYPNITANKFSIYTDTIEERDMLFSSWNDILSPISHNEKVHEIVPKGFSKGNAIRKICSSIGCDIKDTISFGDSANDIDMFRATNISICMGSGFKIAKENASMVTTDFENGIYDACKKMGLI